MPAKRTVYAEYLPDWARLDDQSQVFKNLVAGLSKDFHTIDLYDTLMKAKGEQPTYYRTDSHWNEWGAFVAFQEIMAHMSSFSPLSIDPSVKRYSVEPAQYREGDFARMLYQRRALTETVPAIVPRFGTHVLSEESRQDYGAKWGWSRITRSSTQNKSKVMVLGDSFSLWLEPFFAEHFDLSVRTMHRRGRFDYCLLEEIEPDIVVFEITEQRITTGFQDVTGCQN